jgi:hypothetical protein
MTVNTLIEILSTVPDHLRERDVLAMDDDELEMEVHKVRTLSSGSVVIDLAIKTVPSKFTEEDIREVRLARAAEYEANANAETNASEPTP